MAAADQRERAVELRREGGASRRSTAIRAAAPGPLAGPGNRPMIRSTGRRISLSERSMAVVVRRAELTIPLCSDLVRRRGAILLDPRFALPCGYLVGQPVALGPNLGLALLDSAARLALTGLA
jgi:hypothetical protein